jgi:hypothetical protein
MAATIIGGGGVTFGGGSESAIYLESLTSTTDSNKSIATDEDGDVVAVAFHGVKTTVTASGISKGGGFGGPGGAAAIASVAPSDTGGGGTFYIDSSSITISGSDWKRASVTATAYDGI